MPRWLLKRPPPSLLTHGWLRTSWLLKGIVGILSTSGIEIQKCWKGQDLLGRHTFAIDRCQRPNQLTIPNLFAEHCWSLVLMEGIKLKSYAIPLPYNALSWSFLYWHTREYIQLVFHIYKLHHSLLLLLWLVFQCIESYQCEGHSQPETDETAASSDICLAKIYLYQIPSMQQCVHTGQLFSLVWFYGLATALITRKVFQNLTCVTTEVRHLVLLALCKSPDVDPAPTTA